MRGAHARTLSRSRVRAAHADRRVPSHRPAPAHMAAAADCLHLSAGGRRKWKAATRTKMCKWSLSMSLSIGSYTSRCTLSSSRSSPFYAFSNTVLRCSTLFYAQEGQQADDAERVAFQQPKTVAELVAYVADAVGAANPRATEAQGASPAGSALSGVPGGIRINIPLAAYLCA